MDAICGFFQPLQQHRKSKEEEDDVASTVSKPIFNEEDVRLHPFLPYSSDGYKWPSLYDELDECIEACVLIFTLAELRRMARAKEVEDPKKILSLPLTHSKIMKFVEENREKLSDTKFAGDFYLNILAAAEDRNMMVKSTNEGDNREEKQNFQREVASSSIIAFDDEFEKEELVYAIEVSHKRKIITVCFRGSVTKTDWAFNFEIYMQEVPNPVKKERANGPPTVKLHNGFRDYLFEPSSRGAQGPNGETLSEYQEILQEHVVPIIQKCPGYKLYITGHSLGAALATLFAFEAAAEPDNVIPKPVSLFTFGGPYVGDETFRAAFQASETQGKLRHMRVSNHKDIVCIVPKMAWRWKFYDPSSHVGALFKHVGLNLRLYEGDTPMEFKYPKVHSGFFSATLDELSRGWDQTIFTNFSYNPSDYWKWPFHSLRAYNKRVRANKPVLQSIQLNDLYGRKDVVGQLVPQF